MRPNAPSRPAQYTGPTCATDRWAAIGEDQAATPFALWWLPPASIYAIGLVFIAAVYIGFSVADGRWKVIAAETTVATVFVVVAAAVTGPAWLLVAGLTGHGLKDLWQHRTQLSPAPDGGRHAAQPWTLSPPRSSQSR